MLLTCAATRPHPTRDRSAKMGLSTHTDYLWMHVPTDALDEWDAEKGYVGSRKDHVYHAAAGVETADAEEAWLECRRRPCSCDPCLQRNWAGCLLKNKYFPNPIRRVQIERRSGKGKRRQKRTRDSKAFRESIGEGTVLVARIYPSSDSESDSDADADADADAGRPAGSEEQYYLGMCCRRDAKERLVWKNGKSQRFSNNLVPKGTDVVRFVWLHHRAHLTKPGSPGARAYQLVPNEDTVVFPTKTIISNVKVHAAAQHLDRDSDPATMWLSEADHESILEHPMELIA